MVTTTLTYTPWGWTKQVRQVADGGQRVSTPSHGGLKLSRERWNELPGEVRDAMYTQTFAEEDCEEVIVRTLLGLGDDRERELAFKVAGYFDRYTPALRHLRAASPGPHYHVIGYFGGYGTDGFGHFDTREEAEAFAADGRKVRDYGRLEAVECELHHNGKGGRP